MRTAFGNQAYRAILYLELQKQAYLSEAEIYNKDKKLAST
jgi:hypothetical protein